MLGEEVQIKGNQDGVLVYLDPTEQFSNLKEQLREKVTGIDHALLGKSVVIDIGSKLITRNEAGELKEILEARGLNLRRIVGRGRTLMEFASEHEVQDGSDTPTAPSLFINRNLRSGQRVIYPGNVIVMGDVNPGAEIIAHGNILVMGTLRGMAHAGARGNDGAVIAALRLLPTQIRIANHITRPPEREHRAEETEPELARIKSGKVVIEKFRL